MNILTSLAQILRPTSKPEGVFVIRPGWSVIEHLRAAEAWGPSVVIFMPGDFDMRETFEFRNVTAILGHGIGITRIKRYGQKMFHSVWDYANMDHPVVIGGFSFENMVSTDVPSIELGSQQNLKISDIYSFCPLGVNGGADLLCFTNAERTETPPPNKPVGTWTENITIERVVVYGPKSAAIRFRCTDPRKRDQSFSYLRMAAQITLVTPESIGIDFESHCHVYAGEIAAKFNAEGSQTHGDATFLNVGPECNLTGNFFNCFCEGAPIYGPDPTDGRFNIERPVMVSAGYRIRVASSARVSGHGKFYRQRESHTPDDIVAGVNYAGEQSGYVKGPNWDNPILADEGI